MSKASSARDSFDLVLNREPLSRDTRIFGRGMD